MQHHTFFCVVSPTCICLAEVTTNTTALSRVFSSAHSTVNSTQLGINIPLFRVSRSICPAEVFTNTTALKQVNYSPAHSTVHSTQLGINIPFFRVSRSICLAEAPSDAPTLIPEISSPVHSRCHACYRSTPHCTLYGTTLLFLTVSRSICLAVALADTACLRILILLVNVNNTTTTTLRVTTTTTTSSGEVNYISICLAEANSDTPHSAAALPLTESNLYGQKRKITRSAVGPKTAVYLLQCIPLVPQPIQGILVVFVFRCGSY